MSESELAEATPRRIGAYRVVRELGRGGMGVVYEALHEHLQRRVAIKLMRPELAADPTQVERFVREGRAAANIRHPHVIDVYEFAFIDRTPYLVMPYLEGPTLAQRLARCERLPLPTLLETLMPVLSAVAAAHAAGVVHRDLKPSNILLSQLADGREVPKVLDFGTSKLLTQAELALTQSAAAIGTPYYMAPEQVRSSRDVDARCDQYALGVILYECATGRMPFDAGSQYELLHAIMSAPLAAPSSLEPSLPAAFDALVLRAMQRDPAQRFASVRELGSALLALASGELRRSWSAEFPVVELVVPAAQNVRPISATLPDHGERALPRAGRAAKLQWYALAAAVLAAAGAWWAMRGTAPQTAETAAQSVRLGAAPGVPPAAAAVSGSSEVQGSAARSERGVGPASVGSDGTSAAARGEQGAGPARGSSEGTSSAARSDQAPSPASAGGEGPSSGAPPASVGGETTSASAPAAQGGGGAARAAAKTGSAAAHARAANKSARSAASPDAAAGRGSADSSAHPRSHRAASPAVTIGDNGAPILE